MGGRNRYNRTKVKPYEFGSEVPQVELDQMISQYGINQLERVAREFIRYHETDIDDESLSILDRKFGMSKGSLRRAFRRYIA